MIKLEEMQAELRLRDSELQKLLDAKSTQPLHTMNGLQLRRELVARDAALYQLLLDWERRTQRMT